MNNIGAIGAGYTQGIVSQSNQKNETEAKKDLQAKNEQAKNTQVSAEDSLNFMAASSVSAQAQVKAAESKVIKISDYVTPEQAERIAGFVTGFEDAIANGLIDIENEFADLTLSDEAEMGLAMAMFEAVNY